MNWEKLKKDYPKAWEELEEYHEYEYPEIDHPEIWGEHVDLTLSELRHLYDFFDSHHIIIEMWWSLPGFTPSIWDGPDIYHFSKYDSRPEAEVVAFEKCFAILEEQLNK